MTHMLEPICSQPQALVVQALRLSAKPRSSAHLAQITRVSLEEIQEVLDALSVHGLVARTDANMWEGLAGKDMIQQCCHTLRTRSTQGSIAYHLGFLDDTTWVAHMEQWLLFLDEHLQTGDEQVSLCLELTVMFFVFLGNRLIQQPDQIHNRMFLKTVLLVQVLCIAHQRYIEEAAPLCTLFYEVSLGFLADGPPLHEEIMQKFMVFSLSKGSISQALAVSLDSVKDTNQTNSPALPDKNLYLSMYRHISNTMQSEESDRELQAFNVIAMGMSHIAMHMRNFDLSEHIYSELFRIKDRENQSKMSLIWLSHYCFVLLRQNKMHRALHHLNVLVNCSDTKQDPLAFGSAARGLALYHLLLGRVRHAYVVLRRETEFAIANNIAHGLFLDPMNLDMLYIFEQQGYAPVPRYELDSTIAEIQTQSSLLLQGAALRIQALRLRNQGASPQEVIALLRESKNKLHPERDVRDLILTVHELANTLTIAGEYEEARRARKIVKAFAGHSVDADASYLQVFRLTNTVSGNDPGSQNAPRDFDQAEFEPSGRYAASALMDGLRQRFRNVSGTTEQMLRGAAQSILVELRCVRVDLFRLHGTGPELLASTHEGPDENLHLISAQLEELAATLEPGVFYGYSDTACFLAFEVDEDQPWIAHIDGGSSAPLLSSPSSVSILGRYLALELGALVHRRKKQDQELLNRIHTPTAHAGKDAGIVGEGMRAVLRQAETAADSDAHILLLGETGVGKELVAKHIHTCSGRSGAFVAIHPASTSETLFESEFFGHERGSFTGASYLRRGFFEEADQGTLFIDEVGDIPPALQTKLLRVLQEHRFMRVGSNKLLSSNFRLITATNKNLQTAVDSGLFRADLLFRIAVIPITIPPLRERRQDILPLVDRYQEHFCKRYDRSPVHLSPEHKTLLHRYDWPGNVRELKNTVERMVIHHQFSPDYLLYATSNEHAEPHSALLSGLESFYANFPSLDELEKDYLRHVLEQTKGRVRGPEGAAALLRMNASTLYAKLKRLELSPK